jgi:hypothetical protein
MSILLELSRALSAFLLALGFLLKGTGSLGVSEFSEQTATEKD